MTKHCPLSAAALKHKRADRVFLPLEHSQALRSQNETRKQFKFLRIGGKKNNNKNEKNKDQSCREMWSVPELTTSGRGEAAPRRAK